LVSLKCSHPYCKTCLQNHVLRFSEDLNGEQQQQSQSQQQQSVIACPHCGVALESAPAFVSNNYSGTTPPLFFSKIRQFTRFYQARYGSANTDCCHYCSVEKIASSTTTTTKMGRWRTQFIRHQCHCRYGVIRRRSTSTSSGGGSVPDNNNNNKEWKKANNNN